MMSHEEILRLFLWEGLSITQIGSRLGQKPRMVESALRAFQLGRGDRGALFRKTPSQANRSIAALLEGGLSSEILKDPETRISEYEGTYLLAASSEHAYHVLDGNLRNIVQRVFDARKKLMGKCQIPSCSTAKLDIAHHHTCGRRELFRQSAESASSPESSGMLRYDLGALMRTFLQLHHQDSVLFLCRTHHTEYDTSASPEQFLKQIPEWVDRIDIAEAGPGE